MKVIAFQAKGKEVRNEKWEFCAHLREMIFFLSRRSTQIVFSLIYADFIRDHLHEYYAALQ